MKFSFGEIFKRAKVYRVVSPETTCNAQCAIMSRYESEIHTGVLLVVGGIGSFILGYIPLCAQAQSSHQPLSASGRSSTSKTEDAAELVKQGEELASEWQTDEALALYQARSRTGSESVSGAAVHGSSSRPARQVRGSADSIWRRRSNWLRSSRRCRRLRVMAVSYAFERNTEKAVRVREASFRLQNNWKQYADAAGTANELARIYLESGDLRQCVAVVSDRSHDRLEDSQLTPAQKDLWEFRWQAAQARIAARRGQREQAQQDLAALQGASRQSDNPDQAAVLSLPGGIRCPISRRLQQPPSSNCKRPTQKDAVVLCLLAQTYEKLGDTAHARDYYAESDGDQYAQSVECFRPAAGESRIWRSKRKPPFTASD